MRGGEVSECLNEAKVPHGWYKNKAFALWENMRKGMQKKCHKSSKNIPNWSVWQPPARFWDFGMLSKALLRLERLREQKKWVKHIKTWYIYIYWISLKMVWTCGLRGFIRLRCLQLLPATSQPSTVLPAPATVRYGWSRKTQNHQIEILSFIQPISISLQWPIRFFLLYSKTAYQLFIWTF